MNKQHCCNSKKEKEEMIREIGTMILEYSKVGVEETDYLCDRVLEIAEKYKIKLTPIT